MNLDWSPEQKEIRDAVRDFAEKKLSRDLIDADRRELFDADGWAALGKFGVHGFPIPEEYGGGGLDPLTTVGALESLGYGCRDNGLLFSMNAHMWTCAIPIWLLGSDAQKERYLPQLCSGELIGGNAMTEPESGSDAYSLRTTAKRVGDTYLLSGSKVFVTNAPVADVVVVFATVDPAKQAAGVSAFIVETTFPGFTVGKKTDKAGLRTSPMAELFLDDCRVPVENLLGKEGSGVSAFTHSMDWERGAILATAVGAMQRQLEESIQYAKQRKQFGQSISKFQLVSSKLIDMKLRLEDCRASLYRFGWAKQTKRMALEEAAMAKLTISEAWVQSCLDAIQIRGGYGYMTEFESERDLRDALGSRLYSGTSEIQRQIIAQTMRL